MSDLADVDEQLVEEFDEVFEAVAEDSPALAKAVNARKVHCVAANQTADTILVYLSRGFTAKQLEKLPDHFDGHGIEYRHGVIGQVGGIPPSGIGSPSHYLHNGRITCGSSTGLGGSMGTGTLGALVRINGDLYGLSNNHVIGRCSYGDAGHPVLSPGNLDINANVHVQPFTVGVYHNCAQLTTGNPALVNVHGNLDAAVMRIVAENAVSAMQGNAYQTPATVASPADFMQVQKVGRTTGLTIGTVTGKIAGFQPVSYEVNELGMQFTVYFSEAWVVEGTPGLPFSLGGDSGSLVVGTMPDGTRSAVGLVFAGDGTISLIVPLPPILTAFNAVLDSTHGV
ncbi:hypothetical protein JJ685_10615 [Ramlibacter monticola]|uniref:Uncharacterized protein n=1 Tax=Ramlibacter monticola TaxID=1926872 RepID=A0A936YZL2_9BURK|nr:hypothetical protein [Ramlibacter monticola]MBL0391587.1 hypothetical protein [Ramlibacter monticola]